MLGADAGQVLAVDDDAAAVEPLEARENPQRRRLATTGRPQQGDELARLDGQREAVEGACLTEDPDQSVEFDLRTPDRNVFQE